MLVSKEEFENMIRWNLPGAVIFEIEQNCQIYDWFATISYLGMDGEAAYHKEGFIFHYGMEHGSFCKVDL